MDEKTKKANFLLNVRNMIEELCERDQKKIEENPPPGWEEEKKLELPAEEPPLDLPAE